MAKPLVHSLALLALTALVASSAFAARPLTRQEKDEAIKKLEGKIHQLKGQRNAALKNLDMRYGHIIRSMDPKEIHHQLETTLVVLRDLKQLLSPRANPVQSDGVRDGLNYGGYRIKAHASIDQAEHQVEKALHHDTAEERARAAHDMGAVHEDLRAALVFSVEHPLDGKGAAKDELERRAVENQQLKAALPNIGAAYRLLVAVDHEIKDYNEEKNVLRRNRDQEKKVKREQIGTEIKSLQEEINVLKK